MYWVKLNVNSAVDKFKTRLVACGFTQEAGIDINETYCSVTRYDTIHAVLSVAASEKLKLAHFDVKTAFLLGDIDEVIYMKQPAGYEDGKSCLCKFQKSLHGLQQTPSCWNRKFIVFLNKFG